MNHKDQVLLLRKKLWSLLAVGAHSKELEGAGEKMSFVKNMKIQKTSVGSRKCGKEVF